MTLILGANLDRYVVLAADTRVTYFPPGAPTFFLDEDSKIQTTRVGIIAGAGYTVLIDSVKARFLNEPIKSTNDLLRIIHEEQDKIRGESFMDDPRCGKALDTTGWFFTYVNYTLSHPDAGKLRLAIFHPSRSNVDLALALSGDAIVHLPHGFPEDSLAPMRETLIELLKPAIEEPDLTASIQKSSAVLATFITTLSSVSESVSPTFTIGVHTFPDFVGVSNIVKDGESMTLATVALPTLPNEKPPD
jgi:hypothetical protein